MYETAFSFNVRENDIMDDSINVFYEGNDEVVAVLATSIVSVCANSESNLNINVLDTGLSECNKRHLESLQNKFPHMRVRFIPIDLSIFNGLKGYRAENFLDCYSRLLIPNLAPEVKKAIYLDTDTIALKDIKQLWDVDMAGFALAAPPDLGLAPWVLKHMESNLGVSRKHVYISAGVYMIDCEKWREENISEALLKLAVKMKDKIQIIIEDLFTVYFKDNFKVLDCSWGYIEGHEDVANYIPLENITTEYLLAVKNDIAIVHFAGLNKVWKVVKHCFSKRTIAHFNDFWLYAKATPYFEGMSKYFISEMVATRNISKQPLIGDRSHDNREIVKLLNFLPIMKIKTYGEVKKYYLFCVIPFMKSESKRKW